MNINLTQSLLMGLVSGICELLPISAEAHRGLLRLCFGLESEGAVFLLLCHIAVLTVLVVVYQHDIAKLRRAARLMKSGRRRHQQPDFASACTLRHFQTAAMIVVVCRLFSRMLSFVEGRMHLLFGALLLNGLLLWLPNVMRSGNKDSRNMLRIDSVLMGLAGGLSAIPGVSLVGAVVSVGAVRGVERRFALRFAGMLLIPGLAVSILFDLLAVIAAGALPGLTQMLFALMGAACAAFGSWAALRVMQALSRGGGYSLWSYYSWGMALICFVLFLFL